MFTAVWAEESVQPLRRQGPSGKFSGPTRKPWRGFLVSGAVEVSAASRGLLGAIVFGECQVDTLYALHKPFPTWKTGKVAC